MKNDSNWWCTLCGWYPCIDNWPTAFLPYPQSYVEHGCNERRRKAGTLDDNTYKSQADVDWQKWELTEKRERVENIYLKILYVYVILGVAQVFTNSEIIAKAFIAAALCAIVCTVYSLVLSKKIKDRSRGKED